MEWVGRKVFERGYWKSREDRHVEIEVLEEDVDEHGSELNREERTEHRL